MTIARIGHTATLLNNGQVLVAGGGQYKNTAFPLASAELYDPATGAFTPTGSMNTARVSHTATLLSNGMVLVAGGVNGSTALASAELYDPATGSFTAAGSMTTVRTGQTATLLNNGQVLIAGGGNGLTGTALASAELYDPATGSFTATGSMATAPSGQTATLLNSGKVLVAGGENSIATVNPSTVFELYDPATGTFTATGNMTTGRSGDTATLLNDGQVLVAGGEVVFLYGGSPVLVSDNSAELYDPATGSFAATGSMTTTRFGHTATLLNNGIVLVVGGEVITAGSIYGQALASAELYSPVVLSPTSLSFPNQPSGTTSASQTVTLTNNGSASLTITSVAIGGTNASDFAETGNCVGSIAARASCSINVTFTPTATATEAATLTIINSLTGSALGVSLSGTGIAATRIVALSTSGLTFTSQMVGSTSAAQSFTLTNKGNSVLTVSAVAISGTNASDFTETDTCGGSVAAGASCTINVTFTPTATGTRTGTLDLTDDATSPQSPQTVALNGTGVPAAPVVSLSSTSVVFGNQSLGTTSVAQTVSLRNAGTAVLNIQAVALGGANSGDFAIASGSTCTSGVSISPNGSCVIEITFTPTGLGTRSATVGITDNTAGSPETISLSGMTTPTPLISVTPSNISFPSQYVGTSGLPQSVTVTNNGNAPLSIASVTVSPSDFGTLNACGSSLAAGASCAIGVFFDPTASGARSGTLTINDNAPGSPKTVPLTGTGQDFALAAPVSTATVAAGQTATYPVSVSPGGGFNQTVSFSCAGAPSLSMCSVSPSSATLNGASTTSVTIAVSTTGPAMIFPDYPRTRPQHPDNYRPLVLLLVLSALALMASLVEQGRHRKHSHATVSLLALTLCMGCALTACGGGGSSQPRTPAGTYSLTVTGTFNSGSTTLAHNTKLTLVVQ
jgi:hypothetical protein